jgi:hypothetical protein
MPMTEWNTFLDEYRSVHIVVGDVVDAEPSRLSEDRDLLQQLVEKLEPAGSYSVTIGRSGKTAEICCGFSRRSDADRFADAVRAKTVSRWMGWASQRVFTLDEPTRLALAAALATQGEIDARVAGIRR